VSQTLITGGSGFIGQHLAAALLARGDRVRILDLRSPERGSAAAQYVNGSVLDPTLVRKAMEGVEEVYHLAGLPGMWTPRKLDFHDVNCHGTAVVLAAARESGVRRLLHCSTESILFARSDAGAAVTELTRTTPEEMPGPYTLSKMKAERLAMAAAASGLPVVIANPTMPIGPYRHLTPPTEMLRYFLNRRLQVYMDFVLNLVDVRDVATGLILAMERGRIGERYILGGEDLSLRKLLETLAAMSGHAALLVPFPGKMALIVAAAMEFMADHVTHRPPAATVEGVKIALRSKALSIEKSRFELGYTPRPIEAALRDVIAAVLAESVKSPYPPAALYKSEF
jgi:dihydroflavonol-4-reductase